MLWHLTVVLIEVSLMAINVERVLIGCLDILFHETPLQAFWLLKKLSVQFLLVYGSSLNVLIMNPLLGICSENIFPYSVAFSLSQWYLLMNRSFNINKVKYMNLFLYG